VLARWANPLRAQLTRGADEFLFRPHRETMWPNLISNFVTQSPGRTRPQTQRMRSTWIVEQLNSWVPPQAVMDAAGIESLGALERFMRYVDPVDPDLARSLLRGSTSVQIEF
jgi:hypothetical protein